MSAPRLLISGAINWDTTLFVERLPEPGEELQVRRLIRGPGGKGANTAASAARILGRLQVGLIGGIGTDDIASKQLEILASEGIDTSCIISQQDLQSGQAYIVVDRMTGENIVLTNMSANELSLESVARRLRSKKDNISKSISGSEMAVIIDPPFHVADLLAKRINDDGKELILSPALLTQRGILALKNYLERGDTVILNEHEAKSLLGSGIDVVTTGRKLSKILGGRRVVVTLGKKGCIAFANGKSARIPPLDLHQLGLKVVNTVGAGDSFVGAFAACILKGHEYIESLFLANIAAGLKTTREETRGSPSMEEIMPYAKEHKMRLLIDSIRLY